VQVESRANHKLPRYSPDSRRLLIIEAARASFVSFGFAARTKEIAHRAGVAEGLIFRYFGSKEGLFEAAVIEPLETQVAEMAATAETFTFMDPEERRHQSESLHQHMLTTMTELAPLLGVALFSDRAAGRELYQRRILPLLDQLTHTVRRAMQAWEHPSRDVRLVAMVMWGTYLAVSLDAQLGDTPVRADEFAKEFTELLISGTGHTTHRPGRAASTRRSR
jgi:AcrR family transcriptional regulator